MVEDDQHFWVVTPPNRDGITVPVLYEEVAKRFEEAGWKVERLPLAALEEPDLNCLRKVGWVRK